MKRIGVVVASVALGLSLALVGCGEKTLDGSGTPGAEAVEEDAAASEDAKAQAEAAAKAEAEAAAKAEAEAAAKAEAEAAAALEEEHAALRAAAEDEGLSVFTGTVRVMGGLGLCAYEDVDPNMNGDAERVEHSLYVILVLDEMTHVAGMGGDGSPREGDADHIGIGRSIPDMDFIEDTSSQWADYDGQRICVAGNAWFQSDVSLPFAPRMYDAQLLYQE